MAAVDPIDFQPALIRLQHKAPSPLGRAVLWSILALLALLLVWAMLARLDIVAVAEGKLVPTSYLKIVQPAEQGIVKEILVHEGERVKAGEVLIRLDAALSDADVEVLKVDLDARQLALRRIDAQLHGRRRAAQAGESRATFEPVAAQLGANVRSYESALAEQESLSQRAQFELAAAQEVRLKLEQVLPHYREEEAAFARLAQVGHVSRIQLGEKQRELIEREQDLKSQEFIISSAEATIAQSQQRAAQIKADYEKDLREERVAVLAEIEKLRQSLAKAQFLHSNLELRAPQDGVIKDLATHTIGAVVSPGAALMSLVPLDEKLRAEVWVRNADVGFVHSSLPAKIKLSAYLFQKYGMLDGRVVQVGADAADETEAGGRSATGSPAGAQPLVYRTLIDLDSQALDSQGQVYQLMPGMHVTAEIRLGTRTVLEYLLSPIGKAFHDAGRER